MAKRNRQKRTVVVPKRKIYLNGIWIGSVRICLNSRGIPAPKIISFQFKFFTLPNGTVMTAVKTHLDAINAYKRIHIEEPGLEILISA